MEKKLVARLNEVGQEVGYPIVVFKNGQYQPFKEGVDMEEVAMILYGPLPLDCTFTEFSCGGEDDRKMWRQLFPNRSSVKDAVLTVPEQLKLITYGRRRTVLNYFGRKNFSKRIARAMIARNDNELLFAMRCTNNTLPTILAVAALESMSDKRFEQFIIEAKANGIVAFSEGFEEKLILLGSEAKFVAYVKEFGLRAATQSTIVRNGKENLFKLFIASGGKLAHDIELALEHLDTFAQMKDVYEQAKKQNSVVNAD